MTKFIGFVLGFVVLLALGLLVYLVLPDWAGPVVGVVSLAAGAFHGKLKEAQRP